MRLHCTDLIERCPSQIADVAIKQQFMITDFFTLKMHKWVGVGVKRICKGYAYFISLQFKKNLTVQDGFLLYTDL